MLLQFGNDFCSACESNTGVWHEGNDRVGCSSTPKVIDVDLYACKDPHHQLRKYMIVVSRTVLAALIVQSFKAM